METQRNRQARRRRMAQEGMTLIEVMIVMVIMALVATGAGFMILPQLQKAKIKQTGTDAKTIASAAEMFMAENDECPTVDNLVEEKILNKKLATKDAWGNDYQIECDEDGPQVRSSGPDEQFGTEDDIE
ncbi:MAG: prepilin-type N-terminal cleavage/methylation domain-containing protein [Myxococcales bacterium]|nr:prepilin-type N-terminal cleavage/methylation domain-containing protein [Myxococcales bacterium]